MYHGKYAETRAGARARDMSHVHWWLTAGCCGLLVTVAFVGLTLWLGVESPRRAEPTSTDFHYNVLPPVPPQPPVYRRPEEPRNIITRPGKGKVEKVHKDEDKEAKTPTHLKLPIPQVPIEIQDNDEIRPFRGTLNDGEELMGDSGIKESNIKKKSEAVFPSEFDPDFFLSRGVFNFANKIKDERPDSQFSQHEMPEIPPFTYIRGPGVNVEDRIDNSASNSVYHSDPASDLADFDSGLVGFFRKRLQEVREWLTSRGTPQVNAEWIQLLSAFNQSVTQRNLTAIMSRLKEMYNSTDVADVPISSLLYPDSNNGSSLLSFGLLAVDLFLLHNVQQIAWNEEARLGDQMLEDPEVVAMNALFLPPDRVKQLRQKGSRVLKSEEGNKGMLSEALEFVNSMLRAILNLNKAFKSSGVARSAGPNTMDCIWTLYCRNLDKTARLHGPYGFLAKMNSLGLRLMMGEFPAESAFTQLVTEATTGWRPIDCQRLFPRCGVDEAKDVVMNTVLADTPSLNT